MKLTSPAFQDQGSIPVNYSCDGQDISPELQWSDLPTETQSLVLIVDDPDAPMGTWDHWLIFNIPSKTTGFNENISQFPEGINFGANSWGRNNYGGPCPPDREHRYFFKLYALDIRLDLPDGSTKLEIETAMQGHILDEAQLMGRYDRQ